MIRIKIPLPWRCVGAGDGVVETPKDIVTSTCISNHYSLKPPRQPTVATPPKKRNFKRVPPVKTAGAALYRPYQGWWLQD
jgi:hypothetical protein